MLPVAVKVPDVAAVAGAAARPTAAAAAARVTARERRRWIIRPLLCVLTDMAGPVARPPRTAGIERRGGAHGWMLRLGFWGGLLAGLARRHRAVAALPLRRCSLFFSPQA